MLINTTNFGDLAIDDSSTIHFEEGLPGFEDEREFVLLNNYDTEEPVPFMWLQSTKTPERAFVVAIPFFLNPSYEFEIPEEECKTLNIESPDQVGVYSICKIDGKVEDMTFNLMSPIVINGNTRKAKQIVLLNSNFKVDERISK